MNLKDIRTGLDEALTYERLEEARRLAGEGYRLARYKEVLYEMEYFKGEIALIEGKRRRAINHFDKAIRYNPQDAESYNDKAIVLAELGHYKEAMEWIDKGIQIDPDYATLYHNKAWVLVQMNKPREALEFYKKALMCDNRRAVTFISIGDTYTMLGDHKASVDNYKKGLKLLPDKYKEIKDDLRDRLRLTRDR